MDLIRIEGLELRCIVGLRSSERHREQPLCIDIGLGLDLSSAGRSGWIGDTADYSRVADEITALLRLREYRLLEVAAEEAAAFLFSAHPAAQKVHLRLDKPEALAGRARSAAIEITRTRGAFGSSEVPTEYGGRTEILAGPEATIELLRVLPGHAIRLADRTRRLECSSAGSGGTDRTEMRPIAVPAGEETEYAAEKEELRVSRCVVHEVSPRTSPDATSHPR